MVHKSFHGVHDLLDILCQALDLQARAFQGNAKLMIMRQNPMLHTFREQDREEGKDREGTRRDKEGGREGDKGIARLSKMK